MKKRFIKTPLVGVQVHGAKDVGTRTVNLLMGEHAGEYVRGDIMDANAVIQAFDELKGNVDNDHNSLEEIVDEIHNLRDATDQSFEVFQEKAEEETANRIQGDKTLDEKIDQKERESKERDNVLQQNIDTEKQERVNADTQLRNDLTAEVNRAKASENALSSDIQAEATKRENDDNTIKDNLNAEVTRATAKENLIKAEVDVINGDSTTEGSFRKAIADVVGAAPEAYDTLKEIADKLKDNDDLHTAINDAIATKATTVALNEEITRAKAAEAENKTEIAAEAARAKEVEGDNALAIQNELSRATTAEGAINEAVNTEVERAKGQEAYLQNLVNAKADTTALEGAKTELNNKLASKADTTTLNEQVDTLNAAINAKLDAGNYIPYDPSIENAYLTDKNLYIKVDDANAAHFGPNACIRLKSGDTNNLAIDYVSMSLKNGGNTFNVNPTQIKQVGDTYKFDVNGSDCIKWSTADDTVYSKIDMYGLDTKISSDSYTRCGSATGLDIKGYGPYNGTQTTLNPDQLFMKKSDDQLVLLTPELLLIKNDLNGAKLLYSTNRLVVLYGSDNYIELGPYANLASGGLSIHNGSNSNLYIYPDKLIISKDGLSTTYSVDGISNSNDAVSFKNHIIQGFDVILYNSGSEKLSEAIRDIRSSKLNKITPTTELDLTSIDTADIESLRSIVKSLATELNTLGLIKLKSAEETA